MNDYITLLMPAVALIVSIAAGAKVGEFISMKTKRKAIGWPAGVLVFLLIFSVFGRVM